MTSVIIKQISSYDRYDGGRALNDRVKYDNSTWKQTCLGFLARG